MNSEESSPVRPESPAASNRVSLSPYVNEKLPDWEELLSAHDVARLTRRPRWMLASLSLLGRFPHKQRFHGRGIGWLKADVIAWMTRGRHAKTSNLYHSYRYRCRRGSRQHVLPLEWRSSHATPRGLNFARRTRR
jgi:predicted DNA-binding transcriptional regulator AlpA